MSKIRIASGEFKGGLEDSDATQKYEINYMPEETIGEKHYGEKIELVLRTPKKFRDKDGKIIYAYNSLRFTIPEQIRIFMFKMLEGMVYFEKKQEKINEMNKLSRPKMFATDIENRYHKYIQKNLSDYCENINKSVSPLQLKV